jgi:hypothetical protein
MNVIFVTMGSMYKPYFDAYQNISKDIDTVGFYVSDRYYFESNKRDDDRVSYLKEWEITQRISEIEVNLDQIMELESKYCDNESLWRALNNDRRIFLGKYAKNRQEYTPSYGYEDMLKLFQTFTQNIEAFIAKIEPDIIFGMTPSTIGDYLFYRVARAKRIEYYTLKTVKVGKYQTFTRSIREEHEHIYNTFVEYKNGVDIETKVLEETKEYILKFNKGDTAYEGNVAIPKSYPLITVNYLVVFLKSLVVDILNINRAKDHHSRGFLAMKHLYNFPIKNYKANRFKSLTKSRTIFELNKIEKEGYIFFPLHSEPEIAITNYARFYQNQIEFIRNIALQLPCKYKLLVKEHPRNIGRRSDSYYKKILDIPNVDFADFDLPSIEVVKRSDLVIVLSGNIGFEAVLNKVPVISFGNTIYNMLPNTMVNYLDNIKDLYNEIEATINNYNYSEEILEKFISAIIKNSFPLDLYTVLLKKSGREGGSKYSNELYQKNIDILSSKIKENLFRSSDV